MRCERSWAESAPVRFKVAHLHLCAPCKSDVPSWPDYSPPNRAPRLPKLGWRVVDPRMFFDQW